jgi:hypothetical protein
MAGINIEPLPLELALYRREYDALVEDLVSDGYDVEVLPPIERRGGIPYGDIGTDARDVYDVVVTVSLLIGNIVSVQSLVTKINRRLRGKKGTRQGDLVPPLRRGILYLPDGRTHSWDIPEE